MKTKKLKIDNFQISKLKNPSYVYGGSDVEPGDGTETQDKPTVDRPRPISTGLCPPEVTKEIG